MKIRLIVETPAGGYRFRWTRLLVPSGIEVQKRKFWFTKTSLQAFAG